MSAILIPGNIKQSMMPIQVDPWAAINDYSYESSSEIPGSAKPQLFSFRPNSQQLFGGPFARLNICPSTFSQYVNNDSGFQYLFMYNKDTGEVDDPSKNITANAIFDSLPGIQIREFLPDTRLEQALNVFNTMIEKMRGLFTKSEEDVATTGNTASTETDKSKQKNDTETFFTKIKDTTNWILDYLTGGVEDNFIKDMEGKLGEIDDPAFTCIDDTYKNYMIRFPYMLYYLFQSSVTTNIYEVPCQLDTYFQSSGHEGWEEGGRLDAVSGLNMIPGVGKMMSSLLGNVSVNYLPFWDSSRGSSTAEPDITIQFDLYNDTFDAAIANYLFIYTLIGNNRWLQYNVFQHSSSIYDVKIEGRQRLFACSANFKVSCKGIMRDIPAQIADTLTGKHEGLNYLLDKSKMLKNRIVKIPDIFTVEMTFKSLLPANFNNFIFSYVQNTEMLTETKFGHKPSLAVAAIDTAITEFIPKVKAVWEGGAPESKGQGKKPDGT